MHDSDRTFNEDAKSGIYFNQKFHFGNKKTPLKTCFK